jgi:hypothetical protein
MCTSLPPCRPFRRVCRSNLRAWCQIFVATFFGNGANTTACFTLPDQTGHAA